MAAYHVERFEVYTKEIFGKDFCAYEIEKISKPSGEYNAILELRVADNIDSDAAGEISVKLEKLLEKAPAFAKAYGKFERPDGSIAIWLEFEDVRPYDLDQRVELFCYDLDPDADPVSVETMRNLWSKYNCKLLK